MGITHANKTTVKTEQDSLILEGTLQQQLKQSTKFNEVINTTSKEALLIFFFYLPTHLERIPTSEQHKRH